MRKDCRRQRSQMIGLARWQQAGPGHNDHDRIKVDPNGFETELAGSVGCRPAAIPWVEDHRIGADLGTLQNVADKEFRKARIIGEEAFPTGLQPLVALRRTDLQTCFQSVLLPRVVIVAAQDRAKPRARRTVISSRFNSGIRAATCSRGIGTLPERLGKALS
jgi:hypothetical protein